MTNDLIGPHVALVGYGRRGRLILPGLLAIGCRVSVADAAEAERIAAMQGGALAAAAHWRDLPGMVEGFVVAGEADRAAMIGDLVETELPILADGPLTRQPASAAVIALAAPERVFILEAGRYHPGVEALAAVARSGELGGVEQLIVRRLQWGCDAADAMWTLAPAAVAVVAEILGDPGEPSWAGGEWHEGRAVGLSAAFAKARIDVSIRRTAFEHSVELICEDGVARLAESEANHILIFHDDDEVGRQEPVAEVRPVSTETSLVRALGAFAEHLDGGPAPKASAGTGARTVEIVAVLRTLAGIDP
jgi:predicted dehydrogenase